AVPSGPGLVLSTRSGDGQAFRHQGTLSRGELEETLHKYGNGRVVVRTETLERMHTSFYASPDGSTHRPAIQPAYQPIYAPPMYHGGFGSGFGGGFGGFGGGFGGGGRGGC